MSGIYAENGSVAECVAFADNVTWIAGYPKVEDTERITKMATKLDLLLGKWDIESVFTKLLDIVESGEENCPPELDKLLDMKADYNWWAILGHYFNPYVEAASIANCLIVGEDILKTTIICGKTLEFVDLYRRFYNAYQKAVLERRRK